MSKYIRHLIETVTKLSKIDVEEILRRMGYENFKINGNKINVLVQIPEGQKKAEFRKAILDEILSVLQHEIPEQHPQYSSDTGISSLGGIVFPNSPVQIVIKDTGKQGDKSAGVANELELAGMLQSIIQKYGSVDVTFKDQRGKKLSILDCTEVDIAGRTTTGRRKADVVLKNKEGSLPISIKKLDADMWESADNLFGARARKILQKLIDDHVIKLKRIGTRTSKKDNSKTPVYELSKEIVMEPTEQEALDAIFGTDISPEGGVVIQTFKPEHFVQDGNSVIVDCHSVIANSKDIPESHLMVWLLRNDSTRNGGSLGIAGIRPLGVTLTRGIGKKGNKDVILVDVNGDVVKGRSSSKETDQTEKEFINVARAITGGTKSKPSSIPKAPALNKPTSAGTGSVGRAKRK